VAGVEPRELKVGASDGRSLAVQVAGPEGGDVVFQHSGTPGAGPLYEPLLEEGAKRGLRHVSYDRPGYADSDRLPGRSVADCAADVTAIADALGIERFYTTGQSGGGPHALACAALLPDRVWSAATTAGAAPYDVEGFDWKAGMAQDNVDEFEACMAGDAELEAFLERWVERLDSVTGDDVLAALGDLISEPDRRVLTGAYAEHAARSLRESIRNGIWGWFDDDKGFFGDWGFDLGAIEVPVTIWQGGEDRMVPFPHGQWLADHVSGAKSRLLPAEGHLSLGIGSYGDVLDDLIASRR
jgi:pimeloyl-ACP methyl ester carboxylesterase